MLLNICSFVTTYMLYTKLHICSFKTTYIPPKVVQEKLHNPDLAPTDDLMHPLKLP